MTDKHEREPAGLDDGERSEKERLEGEEGMVEEQEAKDQEVGDSRRQFIIENLSPKEREIWEELDD